MQRRLHLALCLAYRRPPLRRLSSQTVSTQLLGEDRPKENTSLQCDPYPARKLSTIEETTSDGTPRSRKRHRTTTSALSGEAVGHLHDAGHKRSHRSPLEPNKVDLYLAALRAEGKEPSLTDIDRCRPSYVPAGDSPDYPEKYNELVDRLCRTFSKDQLRRFGQEYGLGNVWTRSGRRKSEYAESVIEKVWGWPNLKELERLRRDKTEITQRSFPITASDLFLLLGRDGSELLQISLDFNVHISVTQEPLALRIEGLRGAMKKLDIVIAARRKTFLEDIIELPSKQPIRADLLQRISRLAGAFIENVGYKGKVRICAKTQKELEGATRLAIRIAAYVAYTSGIRYLAFLPEDPTYSTSPSIIPSAYALYPFLPQRSIPWTMKVGGAFRVRKVSEWLGEDLGEEVRRNGGISVSRGRIIDQAGAIKSVDETFLSSLPANLPGHDRVVTASTGHVLFISKASSARTTLAPPVKGSWQFQRFLNALKSGELHRSFVPSLPAPLHNAPPSRQRILHRLIYRTSGTVHADEGVTAPSRIIKFEMNLNVMNNPTRTKPTTSLHEVRTNRASDTYNEQDGAESAGRDEVEGMGNVEDTSKMVSEIGISSIHCAKGIELEFDLSLPDRPMDLRLSVSDIAPVTPGETPGGLIEYLTSLRAFLADPSYPQPDPPIHLSVGDQTFTLEVSSSVRQSNEMVDLSHSAPDTDSNTKPTKELLGTRTESILDLETNQKSMSCVIYCDTSISSDAWKQLLRQCDQLTSLSYKPSGTGVKAAFDDDSDSRFAPGDELGHAFV
ncbi:hypothetical protein BD410DRAFT_780867 [Rickenella mellea]|uniref:Uncharacterized protein n=1 Tax=Rickenella mellea TaxID=50990 RepID=A0A4Y7QNB8_9AGAM|nr:hypothetical protein BD410DRAFT_780867 [Rickenella mellea]